MTTAGVAELKARLTTYLRRVKAGEEILITDRGEPVAKLVPLGRDERRDSRRGRLARAGLLSPGAGRIPEVLLSPPEGSKEVGAGVLRALLAEREAGR